MILLVLNCAFYFLTEKIYWKGYFQHLNKNQSLFLLADSHGLPLKQFSEKYGLYNFSAASDSYEDMFRKSRHLIQNSNVQTIYLSVDDHTLAKYREELNNLDRSTVYSLPSDYDSYYSMIKQKYIRNYCVLFNPKSRSAIRKYLVSLISRKLGVKRKSRRTIWAKLTEKERQKIADARRSRLKWNSIKSKKLTASLLKIVTLCKQNKVELIGIKFPLTKNYIRSIGNDGYKADSIFQSHGLTVLDFSSIFIEHNEYFENQDHLNELGGELFSKVLADSL